MPGAPVVNVRSRVHERLVVPESSALPRRRLAPPWPRVEEQRDWMVGVGVPAVSAQRSPVSVVPISSDRTTSKHFGWSGPVVKWSIDDRARGGLSDRGITEENSPPDPIKTNQHCRQG